MWKSSPVPVATGVLLALGLAAVVITNSGAGAQTLQQAKQQLLQQLVTRAQASTNRAQPTSPVATSPAAQQQAPFLIPMADRGGFNPEPLPIAIASEWNAGGNQDNPVVVISGSALNNPQEGLIWVTNLGSPSSWDGEFVAPGNAGSITITGIQGTILSWSASGGQSGTFNMAAPSWSQATTTP